MLELGHISATGGMGFGLSIIKRIAEAHEWEVMVTDGQDSGARFEFSDVRMIGEQTILIVCSVERPFLLRDLIADFRKFGHRFAFNRAN